MATIPVVGLDVDGVIALDEPVATPTLDFTVSAWGRWRREIRVPVQAADVVARLAEVCEIVWVSAWGHNAHTALAPILHLPERPWLFLPVQFDKPSALARYAGERPWVLIEDSVGGGADGAFGGHVVLVDPTRGIAEIDADDLCARVAG
ncbi:MAG TPA: hypothetical protein VME22_02190 [Solirubrobacteraceae bacterium]|nr:hypothetical protein [Solirubrobacteraceae bacterium]